MILLNAHAVDIVDLNKEICNKKKDGKFFHQLCYVGNRIVFPVFIHMSGSYSNMLTQKYNF